MVRAGKKPIPGAAATAREFCETTTVHGFSYWVSGLNALERLFWVAVTLAGFTAAGIILKDAVIGWIDSPSMVSIASFSYPATALAHPAITVCKSSGGKWDVGEYVRNVYNQFEYVCSTHPNANETGCSEGNLTIRDHFEEYINLWPKFFHKLIKTWAKAYAIRRQRAKTEDTDADNLHFSRHVDYLLPAFFPLQFGGTEMLKGGLSDPRGDNDEPVMYTELVWNLVSGADNWWRWAELVGIYWQRYRPCDLCEGISWEQALSLTRPLKNIYAESWEGFTKIPLPETRYTKLLDQAANPNNVYLWQSIYTCVQNSVVRNQSGIIVHPLNENLPGQNYSCLGYSYPSPDLYYALFNLTEFDTFLVSQVIANKLDIYPPFAPTSWPDPYNDISAALTLYDKTGSSTTASALLNILFRAGQSHLVRANVFETERIFAEILFLTSIKVPELDFGNFIASVPTATQKLELNDRSKAYSNHEAFGCKAWKAFIARFVAPQKAFTEMTPQDLANITCKDTAGQTYQAHPVFLAESFLSEPYAITSPDMTPDMTVEALAKLLVYHSFLKAQVEESEKKFDKLVAAEADKYPYKKKAVATPSYFSPLDLEGSLPLYAAITDAGLCHVYNGNTLRETYDADAAKRQNELSNVLDKRRGAWSPKMINGTGMAYKKTLWLNIGDKSAISFASHLPPTKGSATVSINEWLSYYNVRMNLIDVRAGQEVRIKVEPVYHSASDRFKALSLEQRKCRFRHETPLTSMDSNYNLQLCRFECRLREAFRKAGCVPWDYPLPLDLQDAPICRSNLKENGRDRVLPFENQSVFDQAMGNSDNLDQCNCMPNCEETLFKTQVNTVELNADDLCNPSRGWGDIDRAMADWEKTRSPLAHWSRTLNDKQRIARMELPKNWQRIQMVYGLPMEEVFRVCKERYRNDLAKVTVEVAAPDVMRIEKDIKASFSDQLGVIGGTLGLFTGMSIISMVETVFWMYKGLVRLIQ